MLRVVYRIIEPVKRNCSGPVLLFISRQFIGLFGEIMQFNPMADSRETNSRTLARCGKSRSLFFWGGKFRNTQTCSRREVVGRYSFSRTGGLLGSSVLQIGSSSQIHCCMHVSCMGFGAGLFCGA